MLELGAALIGIMALGALILVVGFFAKFIFAILALGLKLILLPFQLFFGLIGLLLHIIGFILFIPILLIGLILFGVFVLGFGLLLPLIPVLLLGLFVYALAKVMERKPAAVPVRHS